MGPSIPVETTDVDLNFIPNPNTGDIGRLVGKAAITRSAINLVLIRHYERPFHPEKGCTVMDKLFHNVPMIVTIEVERSIKEVLTNYEPRITGVSVVAAGPVEANGFTAKTYFYINNMPEPVSVGILLERSR